MSYKVEDLPLKTWMSEGKNAGFAYRGERHFGRVWITPHSEERPWRAVCRRHPLGDVEPDGLLWTKTLGFETDKQARAWVESWRP